MPNTWFTADFHLGHANIIRYCSRPFANVEEMDQTIVERLNASVKPNDVLYFLGDFCLGSQTRVRAYRRRIRCNKIFAVPGNHDKQACKLKKKNSPGSTSWLSFRSTVKRSCCATTPCASGTVPIEDHGTSSAILMDVCRRCRAHSPWMWESTPTTFVRGTMTRSPTA